MSPPSSVLKNKPSKKPAGSRQQEELLGYFSTLKMDATCSSETLADFQWTMWNYMPEGRTLQPYTW
jgi:hypothetical protein